MATTTKRDIELDHAEAEGLGRDQAWRTWMLCGLGLTSLLAIIAIIVAIVSVASPGRDDSAQTASAPHATGDGMGQMAARAAPTLADAKGIAFEKFEPVDPTLPAVPAGAVKQFTVGVDQHVVQLDPQLAPVQAWTYTVNGEVYKGTAASPPMVVNEGDKVQITFANGVDKSMHVTMPHSIDLHAAQVAPNANYTDVAPGQKKVVTFVAKHPGVFMYHCATQPVLMHTGAGMTGMMVVRPRNLRPVAKELWVVQNEFYIGQPGGLADMAKMQAETPDVVAFNGYANQYRTDPITVPAHAPLRIFVLNAGPSKWSAFHVIGTVFDDTDIEGVEGHDSQTVSLAPSQGGWVDFTLDQPGNYTFVTHSFGDMVKGAAGILHTPGAPMPKAPAAATPAAASGNALNVTLGEMFVKTPVSSTKAGKVTFRVENTGQTAHQFGIVAAPAKLTGGIVDPATVLAQSKQLNGGDGDAVTATLKPGSYDLICLMAGHYAAGQHIPFTVTG